MLVRMAFTSTCKEQVQANTMTKQCEVGDNRGHSSKGASFIKVLGRDFYKQLKLPEDFTRNMNGYIPRRFIIESGITKKCWRVEVKKDGDGRMYFHNGWEDFVEAHSLEVGNFLLFEYEEQSIFQVRIYSRNGCERTLLLDSTKGGDHKTQNIIDDEDGEDIEALEFKPVIIKCREPKTRKLAPRKYGKDIQKTRYAGPKSCTRTAKISTTGNNMCFSIIIHHSKEYQFKQLTIPKEISLKLKLAEKDEVKLQDAQGNSWKVKLSHRRDGRALFAQGWKEFLKDNKVSSRDKLQFEFMSEEVIQVLVTKLSKIERESDATTSSFNSECKHDKPYSTHASKYRTIGMQKTSRRLLFCDSGNSFSCIWRESSARKYMYLPVAIVQAQNLVKKNNIALRDPEGKCCPIELKKLTGNRVAFTKGWEEFWRGYGLANGDFLNFKFVSENLIQVSMKKNTKPPPTPEVEEANICLDAMDTTARAAVIEPEVNMSREEFDASIELGSAITLKDFDENSTQPGANDVIN